MKLNPEDVSEIIDQFYKVLDTPEQHGFYETLVQYIYAYQTENRKLKEEVLYWQSKYEDEEDYWIKLTVQ